MQSEQATSITNELIRLNTQVSDIDQRLIDSPDRMRDILEGARDKVGRNIDTVLSSAVTVSELSIQQNQYLEGAEIIQSLVDDEIYSEQEAEEELAKLALHEDFQLLRLSWSLGVVSTTTEANTQEVEENIDDNSENPTHEEVNDSQETLIEKIPTQLTVITKADSTKELKVGRSRGKRHKFSKATNENMGDYTEERLKLLEMLVDAEGEFVDIQSVIKAFEEDDLRCDKDTMRQTREWLKNISFYDESLLDHNGKRGLASKYRLNPKLDVSLIFKTIEQKKPTRNISEEVNKTKPGTAKTTKRVEQKPVEENLIKSVEKGEIPLREAAVFLTYLNINSDLLEALDIPSPNKEMVTEIDEASQTEDRARGVQRVSNMNPEKLESERENVGRQFRAIFNDEELFDAFIDHINSGDVLEPFADYLGTFNDNQWCLLVEQVLRAQVSTTTKSMSQSKNGLNGSERITFINLPNGKLFKRETSLKNGETNFSEVTPEKRRWTENEELDFEPELTRRENPEQTPEKEPTIAEEGSTSDENSGLLISDKEDKTPTDTSADSTDEEQDWQKDLKTAIGEAISLFEEKEIFFEGTLKASALGGRASEVSSMIGTKTSIQRLINAGIMPKLKKGENPNHRECDFTDLVFMYLFNKNKQILDSGGSKANQKEAINIVKASVKSYIDSKLK